MPELEELLLRDELLPLPCPDPELPLEIEPALDRELPLDPELVLDLELLVLEEERLVLESELLDRDDELPLDELLPEEGQTQAGFRITIPGPFVPEPIDLNNIVGN